MVCNKLICGINHQEVIQLSRDLLQLAPEVYLVNTLHYTLRVLPLLTCSQFQKQVLHYCTIGNLETPVQPCGVRVASML